MKIAALGINHRSAPVEIREKLAFSKDEIPEALRKLTELPEVDEAVIVSTCNRVEIYTSHREGAVHFRDIVQFLSGFHSVAEDLFLSHTFKFRDREAIEHLFMVASSADSMVLGETQILSQVKEAYLAAQHAGTTGKLLGQLFQTALNVGKEVHTQTGIGRRKVSVSSVAVDLAEHIFSTLEGRVIMVLGAGEMSELTLVNMLDRGASKVLVTNRTFEKAEALARRFGGTAFPFQELGTNIARADIVISGTGAPMTIIKPEHVREALRIRRNQPIFLIDIAVPRDIDPAVNEIDNAFLYDIDDMEKVVAENMAEREKEVAICKHLITHRVSEFMSEMQVMDVGPLIAEVHRKVHNIGEEELARVFNKLGPLSEKDRQEIEYLANRIINKVLHSPTIAIREAAAQGNGFFMMEAAQKLFDLDEDDGPIESDS